MFEAIFQGSVSTSSWSLSSPTKTSDVFVCLVYFTYWKVVETCLLYMLGIQSLLLRDVYDSWYIGKHAGYGDTGSNIFLMPGRMRHFSQGVVLEYRMSVGKIWVRHISAQYWCQFVETPNAPKSLDIHHTTPLSFWKWPENPSLPMYYNIYCTGIFGDFLYRLQRIVINTQQIRGILAFYPSSI